MSVTPGVLSSAAPATAVGAQTAQGIPVIPQYEVLRRIGRGAYGEVWLARNLTGSFVAVKVVSRGVFDDEHPFEREYEGIKRFEPISRSDASQVAILHVGRGEGCFYYVMELADDLNADRRMRSARRDSPGWSVPQTYSPGTSNAGFAIRAAHSYVPHTLREDLKRHRRLPIEQCLEVGLALTQSLGHLHACGLVHRDVKPSNVIYVGAVPKLADIGLVTSVDATRSFVGTEGYVAPEGPGTPQADLYSLGKLLYEISTGQDRSEFPALPPDLATRPDREALSELNAIIVRACSTDPGKRYPTAAAMSEDLLVLQRGKSVRRKRELERCWRTGQRAAMTLAACAVLAAGVLWLARELAPAYADPDGPLSPDREANAICTEGLKIIRGDNYADFPKAYAKFHRAMEIDPHFARPYIGLLELLLREGNPAVKPYPGELRDVSNKLQVLAPHSAAAYCAQSIFSFRGWNFTEAERQILKAIKANDRYELGHTWYGWMLEMWGRPNEAREQLAKSLTVDSSKSTVYRCFANSYYADRQFIEAIRWFKKALERESHQEAAFDGLARSYRAIGDYTNAIANFKAGDLLTAEDGAAVRQRYQESLQAFTAGGARGYWEQEWTLNQLRPNQAWYNQAVITIHRGDTDGALTLLEKSYVTGEGFGERLEHAPPLTWLLFDECWDGLHENLRFNKLLKNIGFTNVMRAQKQ